MKFDSHFISNIILQVILIAAFISIFFFTYGRIVEKNVIVNQNKLIIEHFIKNLKLLPNDQLKIIKTYVDHIKVPTYKAENALIKKNNEKLEKFAFKIIMGLFIGGLILIILLWTQSSNKTGFWKKFKLLDLFKDGLIILIFVGSVEFFIATFILQNYRPTNPNFITKTFLDQLLKVCK
jgi:hypothetical protein